eukprot:4057236-Pyramimonas_sp.AAC.1
MSIGQRGPSIRSPFGPPRPGPRRRSWTIGPHWQMAARAPPSAGFLQLPLNPFERFELATASAGFLYILR